MEVFRGQAWRWDTPLLTMIQTLELGHMATPNCKTVEKCPLGIYLLRRKKRKQPVSVT